MGGYNPTSRAQDHQIARGIIRDSIAHISTGLTNLQAAMHSVETLKFHDIYLLMEDLEEAFGKKTFIDSGFAFLAQRDDAGRLVSSAHATEYFIKRMNLSYSEALDRLRNAETLFGKDIEPDPGPPPTPEPATEDAPADDDSADAKDKADRERERKKAEKEAREREAKKRAERENEAKARNRKKIGTGSIPADVLRMIDYELKQLDRYAQPGRHELRSMALDKARELSKSQLKTWLRKAIRQANANAVM